MRVLSQELKGDCRCADCKLVWPDYVLDWDHRPGEVKVASVAYLIRRSPAAAIAEIEKCDLVCANCHRIRTHERGYENQSKGVLRGDRNSATGQRVRRRQAPA